MAIEQGGVDVVGAMAAIGVLGVGAQWIAWRLNIPAIVLMLLAGLLAGPVFGILNPEQDLGPITGPIISIAVAVILFEGGMTLNLHSLRDASKSVMRLVVIGAPLGWIMSTLALRFGAGLSWESSTVFGGIMIVTGPTVIAPLLRQAKLSRRPAALLQWEAIVNDPIGALAAVLAFEVILVMSQAATLSHAITILITGLVVSIVLGIAAGFGLAHSFRRGWVPEYIKVPLLFVVLIAIFAASNRVLHESGLMAVTVMGMVIANANLPSYEELRRFKEHATVLLVSGVFILLAASMDFATLAQLDLRAVIFLAAVIFVARPLTVYLSLLRTDLPMNERTLIATTGPRGVVLVAVAGLFGERLYELGIEDGAMIGPLAFALVACTVVLHGFTLKPVARMLGLSGAATPGVLIVGGTAWGTELAQCLSKADIPVLVSDANYRNLRQAKDANIPVFFGDILSEAAEHNVEIHNFDLLFAASDNDAYNTLVTTDLGPEFGRDKVFQIPREQTGSARYDLPATLGGRSLMDGESYTSLLNKLREGWEFRITPMGAEFSYDNWRQTHPESHIVALISDKNRLRIPANQTSVKISEGEKIIHFSPKRAEDPVK